jgi:hypothetical protein
LHDWPTAFILIAVSTLSEHSPFFFQQRAKAVACPVHPLSAH